MIYYGTLFMINQYKDVRKTTVKKLFRRSYLIFSYEFILYNRLVKGVRIRSYSGQYFPAFGLNTVKYGPK